ncbi:MAG: hypothetical protein RBR86_08105 [Pseudobdellovibrionaceae bacterium]|jgi:hypothetical protein|nr:hypothetical protein [Pseudobdellovibrionaceae bacterium]
MSKTSLTDLMNMMVARVDAVKPNQAQNIPEERYWHMISLYMQVDPILAQLYKQYCDTKDRLGQLLASGGAHDPMTEIAWDMHDSLRSAIDTRLVELKDSTETNGKLAALKNEEALMSERADREARKQQSAKSLDELIAFMMYVSFVMKNGLAFNNLRHDFAQAR